MNKQLSAPLSSLQKKDEDEVTILFVSALWFWYLGDNRGANAALDAAVHIHGLNKAFASDFRS
jgi:hypothetical protein